MVAEGIANDFPSNRMAHKFAVHVHTSDIAFAAYYRVADLNNVGQKYWKDGASNTKQMQKLSGRLI